MFYKSKFLLPPIICAHGAHIANLRNKQYNYKRYEDLPPYPQGYQFYSRGGRIKDIRLHVLFTAPSGAGKDHTLGYFSEERTGTTHYSDWRHKKGGFPTKTINKVTDASLFGTARVGKNGKIIESIGAFKEYPNGIIYGSEISSVLTQFTKGGTSGLNLENLLLQALDNGHINSDISILRQDYRTYATCIWATQLVRIMVGSGFARRLWIYSFMPRHYDMVRLNEVYDQSEGIRPDLDFLLKLQRKLKTLYYNFVPKEIHWEDEYKKKRNVLVESLHLPHFEKELLDRLAIGYAVMTNYEPGDKLLEVRMDKRLHRQMEKGLKDRINVLDNAKEYSLLWLMGEKKWNLNSEFVPEARAALQMTKSDIISTIDEMVKKQTVEKKTVIGNKGGRPKIVVKAAPPEEE